MQLEGKIFSNTVVKY